MKNKARTTKAQRGPSKASLREMPEIDVSSARVRRNPYAERVAREGIVLQVGKGRPTVARETGGTQPRSVRFPAEVWSLVEEKARGRGLSVHAALREAIVEWLRGAA